MAGAHEPSAERSNAIETAQLEKQNERLKEALVKLRDLSATKESEFEKRVRVLEKEAAAAADLKGRRVVVSDLH